MVQVWSQNTTQLVSRCRGTYGCAIKRVEVVVVVLVLLFVVVVVLLLPMCQCAKCSNVAV